MPDKYTIEINGLSFSVPENEVLSRLREQIDLHEEILRRLREQIRNFYEREEKDIRK